LDFLNGIWSVFTSILKFEWLYDLVAALVENVFKLSMDTNLGSSVHFFIYDVIKILMLLSIMIFLISYIRSYFPPERTKKILEKFSGIKGNIMASLLGTVTPFCSCSSVPIFIGFVESGIPLGVTFSFLITSPLINQGAIIVLLAAFGWRVAAIYIAMGVIIGIIGGIIIGKFNLEGEVEGYVYEMSMGEVEIETLTRKERAKFALEEVTKIVKHVWIYLLIGIGIGAAIHGWAPEDLLTKYAGPGNPFAVLVGVAVGIPLYADVIGTIPIAEALISKGMGMGTALSFMMAVAALSLPAMILLRKVIKPKLLTIFVMITSFGIITVGYLFNFLLH
ncbi:permease, partial [Petrocella sp. FN5]|uniref:permease n=1 Tax=Petrocella sp. FN5 TaxID=3032002 RepID=UPI002ED5DCD7